MRVAALLLLVPLAFAETETTTEAPTTDAPATTDAPDASSGVGANGIDPNSEEYKKFAEAMSHISNVLFTDKNAAAKRHFESKQKVHEELAKRIMAANIAYADHARAARATSMILSPLLSWMTSYLIGFGMGKVSGEMDGPKDNLCKKIDGKIPVMSSERNLDENTEEIAERSLAEDKTNYGGSMAGEVLKATAISALVLGVDFYMTYQTASYGYKVGLKTACDARKQRGQTMGFFEVMGHVFKGIVSTPYGGYHIDQVTGIAKSMGFAGLPQGIMMQPPQGPPREKHIIHHHHHQHLPKGPGDPMGMPLVMGPDGPVGPPMGPPPMGMVGPAPGPPMFAGPGPAERDATHADNPGETEVVHVEIAEE